MLQIYVLFDKEYYTFRTNNDGTSLFVGTGTNTQIRYDSGFNSLRRSKRAIRDYLRGEYLQRNYALKAPPKKYPRIQYGVISPGFKL